MNVSPSFDARLMAWSSAGTAKAHATTESDRQLADAVAYLAQSIEQLNMKLDQVLIGQAKLLNR